jgi:hypothetical protein
LNRLLTTFGVHAADGAGAAHNLKHAVAAHAPATAE